MDTKVKKYLYDIRKSIISIESYLGEKRDFTVYKSNQMLRRAIERELEIIGEAMIQANKVNPDLSISSKNHIIGMRHRVIHGYDKIDDEIVWGTIVRHLPTLKKEIDVLLS